MNYRYTLLIQWSEEDKLYLVTLPEFAELAMQPCSYGRSYEEAIANAQEAIAGYLEYCQEEGLTPPSPSSVAA
ncbi:type II toxin-antitoxin system HicB family antitoxin [Roseofilum sp. BLCC_M154]|jgi:predicted RNase H-like HicB family nuclease|uniref:Type II toxin-antitoxin system HicB family antitoxin n=1 Tax=Roseofilum acuticapitatum BLCC-M154 TaxID=3022444 RepID=A0ABT7ARJ4_9CYAN|nr:type II toxin-antitoxin system HicB family antitoxin [Roseofilum acuticapitatum]MDJ1169525.1 type II toxin-antitoxin system HicB family antitoxin [Roseofilum acuticapitatum BLCC-M154]